MNSSYRTQSPDTTYEVERLQLQRWRRLSVEKKLLLLRKINLNGLKLILLGVKHQLVNPKPQEVRRLYLKKRWGEPLASFLMKLNPEGHLMLDDPIALAYELGKIFDSLNILYYVGGSVASSIHGEIRLTQDLDVAIYLAPSQKQEFIKAIEEDFYINDPQLKSASINLIKLTTTEKADLFLVNFEDGFIFSAMNRRIKIQISSESEYIYVCSAEDIVLQKLLWFEIAGNKSEKQWRDILGVLKVQDSKLDFGYLWDWGEKLGVLDNLSEAFLEADV